MAFNQQEMEIISRGKELGKSKKDIETAILRFRTGVTAPKEEAPKQASKFTPLSLISTPPDPFETLGDLKQAYIGIGEQLNIAGEKIHETFKDDSLTRGEQLRTSGAAAFKGGARAFGEGVMGLFKTVTTGEQEEAVAGKVGETAQSVVETAPVQDLFERYNKLSPDVKREVDNALGFSEGLVEILTLGTIPRVARPVLDSVISAAEKAQSAVPQDILRNPITRQNVGIFSESPFPREAVDLDTLINQAETSKKSGVGAVREAVEAGSEELSIRERLAGLQPDIKNRISGKPEKLQEYFDVSYARNNLDILPTPLEHAVTYVNDAVSQMETILNETGSAIGKFRQKAADMRVPFQKVQKVEDTFETQLNKLNLEIVDGTIMQKAGTVRRVSGTNDVKVLQELYDDMRVVKQAPNLERLIDLRMAFDGKINFGRSAREVSDSVDPLSRTIRKEIADVAAEVVGKTEAARLKQYSEFMDTFNELRSYTDRRAGGEFLLKRVLSERGGEPRILMQTIKDYTGIDLMDEATMASVATDLIGNARQKGLFRQEIQKAQLDVAALLRGDKMGSAMLFMDFLGKQLAKPEEVFMEAAKRGVKQTDDVPSPAKTESEAVVPEENAVTKRLGNQRGFVANPLARTDVPKSGYAPVFENFPELSTKVLKELEGKSTVSRQFISDLTNKPTLKQPERDLVRAVLDEFDGDKIPVQEFADKVKARLLPLTKEGAEETFDFAGQSTGRGGRYEDIALPPEMRGNVADYAENIYQSPIRNSAGDVHFGGEGFDNYFAHTRIEDMADGQTRRVIEAQSDLFQKGRLEAEPEFAIQKLVSAFSDADKKLLTQIAQENKAKAGSARDFFDAIPDNIIKRIREAGASDSDLLIAAERGFEVVGDEALRLQPYRNTWWERIVREEVRSAAQDGKTKLQFPTGETAMKIEGLGENVRWTTPTEGKSVFDDLTVENMKVGKEAFDGNSDWIITEVLEDGKFKAVPKNVADAQKGIKIIKDKTTNGETVYLVENGAGQRTSHATLKEAEAEKARFLETDRYAEQFDISGKVDTSNPIYKFYEKDVQKYLSKNYNAKKVTDENGVEWVEFTVPKDAGKKPVEAFGVLPFIEGGVAASQLLGEDE